MSILYIFLGFSIVLKISDVFLNEDDYNLDLKVLNISKFRLTLHELIYYTFQGSVITKKELLLLKFRCGSVFA